MPLAFKRNGNVMEVICDGVTDWESLTESDPDGAFPEGCYIDLMTWKLATAATVFVLRNVNVTGARIIPSAPDDGSGRALVFGGNTKYFPAIKGSECHDGDVISVHFRLSRNRHEL